MKIRKSIIAEVRGQNDKAVLTKALSLVLFYQQKVLEDEQRCNGKGFHYWRIRNFSYNKVHELTGLHASTIRTRLHTLERNGWARRQGNDIVFDHKAIRSSHQRNNYTFNEGFSKITELQDWLLAHIIVHIQEMKEKAKDIFGKATNPKNDDEMKWARRKARERYPRQDHFADYGISYRCLVMNMGIRHTKLKGLLRFAEQHGIIYRQRNERPVNERETAMFRELERTGFLFDYLKQKYHHIVNYYFYKGAYHLCFANTYHLPIPSHPQMVIN
jgi:hypothetical protein